MIRLSFQPSEQRNWKTINGNLVRERGFIMWMKSEFLMKGMLLSHFLWLTGS